MNKTRIIVASVILCVIILSSVFIVLFLDDFLSDINNQNQNELTGTEGLVYELSEDGLSYIVTDYVGKSGDVIVPTKHEGISITRIEEKAFSYSEIRNVLICEGVLEIGFAAFSNSDMESITIPESVTNIEKSAFVGCSKLKRIVIPQNISSLPDGLFADCTNLTEIILPNSLYKIPRFTFLSCTSLKTVSLPNTIIVIELSAFENCKSLETIIMPPNLQCIENYAFATGSSSLTTIELPKSVSNIGEHAFDFNENLNVVIYLGTKAEWSEIVKGEYIFGGKVMEIKCTDGEIFYHPDGNVTEKK